MDTIAVISDLHCNSTVGLCPPYVALDDGGSYRPSKAQRWIWARWLEYVAAVGASHKRNGGKLYIVFNGDMVDGDHHRTTQIITNNITTQGTIAIDAITPLLDLSPDYTFVIRGTEAHAGRSAMDEEAIARDIGAEPEPETGNHSWWHLVANIGGVLIDFAHHGRTGSRYWTRGNSTMSLAADMVMQYAARGDKMPQVAFRAHKHTPVDTGDNYPIRLIQMASWQLSTAFGHKIAAGSVLPIGGYIVSAGDGVYTLAKHISTPRAAKPWKAKK